MFQQAIMNIFETNLKNRKSHQRKQRYKKEPKGNYRTGKYNNQNRKKKLNG